MIHCVLTIVMVLWGMGCSSPECDEETPCGFAETCVIGSCVRDACVTSAQCPMESYCLEGECTVGCQADGDCLPGDVCELTLGQCEPAPCEETEVDCGFREFCDVTTGDCYDAGELYCFPCGNNDECGDGNYCISGFCGVDCSAGQECPAGFSCREVIDGLTEDTLAYQCLTDCWVYEDLAGDPQVGASLWPGAMATCPVVLEAP